MYLLISKNWARIPDMCHSVFLFEIFLFNLEPYVFWSFASVVVQNTWVLCKYSHEICSWQDIYIYKYNDCYYSLFFLFPLVCYVYFPSDGLKILELNLLKRTVIFKWSVQNSKRSMFGIDFFCFFFQKYIHSLSMKSRKENRIFSFVSLLQCDRIIFENNLLHPMKISMENRLSFQKNTNKSMDS